LAHERLLIFGSGLPTAEKPTAERYYLFTHGPDAKEENARAWPNYIQYREKTSILVPLPPALYRRLPSFTKGSSATSGDAILLNLLFWLTYHTRFAVFLLDLPMFRFDPEVDGHKAVENARKQQQA
jgi:hypothetical protein